MAFIYPHKAHGWRIRYKVFFPNGTHKTKDKCSKVKSKANIILKDVDMFEALCLNNSLSPEHINYAIHMKYISPEEARLLMCGKIVIINDPIWTPQKTELDNEFKSILLQNTVWRQLYSQCQSNAKKRNIEFNLSLKDFMSIVERSRGHCELTGISFSIFYKNYGIEINSNTKDPFRPSIDRIISDFGYTKDNIRLVCIAVNYALNQWGHQVFDYIVEMRHKYLQAVQENS